MNTLTTICFFISGAAGLVLEILWSRMLVSVFGSTTLAISTTAAVFMGGLALGAAIAPRLARGKGPALCYAICEAIIGLWALIVPALFKAFPAIQSSIIGDVPPSFPMLFTLRALLVVLALIVPSAAMGASLPILASQFVSRGDSAGRNVGRLYAVNTAGAVVGTMLVGFVLVPAFGMGVTGNIAAGAEFFVAAVMFSMVLQGYGKGVPGETHDLKAQDTKPGWGAGSVPAVAFAAGFIAMALEVVWTRALSVVIGSSTYSFTIILSALLFGVASGSALAAAFIRKGRGLAGPIYAVLVMTGASAFAASVFIDRLPSVLRYLYGTSGLTMTRLIFFNYMVTWLAVFFPTVGMGALFPMLVQTRLSGGGDASKGTGNVYAAATAGNVSGTIAAALFLIPSIGVRMSLATLCAGYLVLAACVAGRVLISGEKRAVAAVGMGAALFASAAFIIAMPSWDRASWVSGMFRVYLARGEYGSKPYQEPEIAFHKDGVASSVTVERRGDGLSLKVNGKVDASNGTDMHTQILSGLWPVLLHENPADAAMVGYGSGVTAGAMLTYPLKSLTVVELEPVVYEAARLFDPFNHRPWSDPRLKTIGDDGRNNLQASKTMYDVIISEPSNPWISGASGLFTKDYWEIAAARLKPGGVFAQWLQLYELSNENIKTLMATYASVFRHILIVQARAGSNDTVMLGSMEPFVIDWTKLDSRMAIPAVRDELSRAEVRSPADFFALLLMDEKGVRRFAGKAKMNTDDNALIEFSSPKDLVSYALADADAPSADMSGEPVRLVAEMVLKNAPASFGDELLAALMRKGRFVDAGKMVLSETTAEKSEPAKTRTRQVFELLAGRERAFPFETAGRDATGEQWEKLVGLLARDDWAAAKGFISEVPDRVGDSYAKRFLSGYLLHMTSDDGRAVEVLEKLFSNPAAVAKYPAIGYFLARVRLSLGRYPGAVEAMTRYLDCEAVSKSAMPDAEGDDL